MYVFNGVNVHNGSPGWPMNQPVLFLGMHGALHDPIQHVIPASALPIDAKVGPRVVDVTDPIIRNDIYTILMLEPTV